ncbi:vomeronasal type-1 receptor 4-like [Rattus rattus]|uniref:vomeronasal type-1 receptor 4-like n=1 Tax=Rattus rattus TaxID=10117 RepID=UPI0013F32DAC|nr:vomeronasal type-1 receptor 4-like [Rattus rattus]
MSFESIALGIFLFSQITVGMIGNSSILFYYVILKSTGKHLMPKDLIIEHLISANFLFILSKGIPQTLSDYGYKDFLDEFGCKLVMYIYRTTRGVSLYMMCLLSCFQAITISPSNYRWMMLKHRTTKYLGPSCSISWPLHLFINIVTPARVSGHSYNKNTTNTMIYGSCSWLPSGNFTTVLYLFLLCFSDGLCLGLMACASFSIVNILYRHKNQVKHIHSAQYVLKVSPEDRATKNILILVCTFVTSYSFSSIVVIFMTYSKCPMLWGVSVFTFLEICFSIFCPFFLITNMKSQFFVFSSCFGKRQLSQIMTRGFIV